MSDQLSHLLACSVFFSPTTCKHAYNHAHTDATFFKLGMYNVHDAITSRLRAHKHTMLYNAR